MELVHEFLCTLDGEGGDDDFALAVYSPPHKAYQVIHGKLLVIVQAVAVRAFHKDVVRCRHVCRGVAHNGLAGAAKVSRVEDADFVRWCTAERILAADDAAFFGNGFRRGRAEEPMPKPSFASPHAVGNLPAYGVFALPRNGDVGKGTAEYVSAIEEFQLHVGRNVHLAVVAEGDNLVRRLYAVVFGKEGPPVEFFALFVCLFAQVFRITSLNPRAVHHHDVCKVPRGGGGVYIALVAVLREYGEEPAMVVMGMGQNNAFNFVRGKVKIAVLFVRLGAFALKGSAVNHKAPPVNFKNMLAARHFLCRAQ